MDNTLKILEIKTGDICKEIDPWLSWIKKAEVINGTVFNLPAIMLRVYSREYQKDKTIKSINKLELVMALVEDCRKTKHKEEVSQTEFFFRSANTESLKTSGIIFGFVSPKYCSGYEVIELGLELQEKAPERGDYYIDIGNEVMQLGADLINVQLHAK